MALLLAPPVASLAVCFLLFVGRYPLVSWPIALAAAGNALLFDPVSVEVDVGLQVASADLFVHDVGKPAVQAR